MTDTSSTTGIAITPWARTIFRPPLQSGSRSASLAPRACRGRGPPLREGLHDAGPRESARPNHCLHRRKNRSELSLHCSLDAVAEARQQRAACLGYAV